MNGWFEWVFIRQPIQPSSLQVNFQSLNRLKGDEDVGRGHADAPSPASDAKTIHLTQVNQFVKRFCCKETH